jgi:hypothetical protein
MAALQGWMGVSPAYRIDSTAAFTECPGYRRTEVDLSGSPTMDQIGRICWTQDELPPIGKLMRYAAIFDAPETGKGHVLCFYRLLPQYTEAPHDIPQTTAMIFFDSPVLMAINSSVYSNGASELLDIGRGMQLGNCNGQTMFAGCRLVASSGRLVSRASLTGGRRPLATVKVEDAAD